jgi:hypothetical protein
MYKVAHATSKPPGPTNLFREEDNRIDNSITQVMQDEADQTVPLLPTWYNLSANVSRTFNRRHMPNDRFPHIRRLMYRMVANVV